jgi:signal peptidase I
VVSIDQGKVSINGSPINEPYISAKATYTGEWNIPEGDYLVLGDNRPDSSDSHNWGFVPRESIVAKAVWIYFPFAQFGKIVDVNFQP